MIVGKKDSKQIQSLTQLPQVKEPGQPLLPNSGEGTRSFHGHGGCCSCSCPSNCLEASRSIWRETQVEEAHDTNAHKSPLLSSRRKRKKKKSSTLPESEEKESGLSARFDRSISHFARASPSGDLPAARVDPFVRSVMEETATAAATEKASSYRYWVREATGDAAPLPVPRKLDPSAATANGNGNPPLLGSVWNQAGTWEEKNLNSWANSRIKELLGSLDSLEFPTGKASLDGVSKCTGDAFLVTVRNKKRVGYNYELSLKFKGEWLIKEEKTKVKGHLDIPEFSFGELEDLEVEVRFSDDEGLASDDKRQICKDLESFLSPIREKLRLFEEELKDR